MDVNLKVVSGGRFGEWRMVGSLVVGRACLSLAITEAKNSPNLADITLGCVVTSPSISRD